MRKFLVLIAAVMLIGGALLLTGCGGRDSDLVGTWSFNDVPEITVTFNEDGSGRWSHDMGFGTRFTWRTSGSNLDWTYDGSSDRMRTTYTVSDTTFTWSDSGITFRYTRVD